MSSRLSDVHRGSEGIRERMLAEAEQLVIAGGGANLGLREVARRAGVSHAAPGHVFGGKRGLLTAVATTAFVRFGEHLVQRASVADTALDRLAASGIAYVEFATANWALFEFMFRTDLIEATDPGYVAAAARSYAVLAEAVSAAQADGWSADRDPDELIHLCWALAHGLAGLSALPGLDTDPAEAAAHRPPSVDTLIWSQLSALGR